MVASVDFTETSLTLNLGDMRLSDEQFQQLCVANPDLRLETSPTGALIVMPPTFGDTSARNSELITQVGMWNRIHKLGKVFDSSGGYCLANGFRLSPDVSWIQNARLEGLSLNQFLPIAPDFVIELRSTTDRLSSLQQKMQAYLENGVQLGWLLNPQDQQAEIYRPYQDKVVLSAPTKLSGENILPGFTLDLTTVG